MKIMSYMKVSATHKLAALAASTLLVAALGTARAGGGIENALYQVEVDASSGGFSVFSKIAGRTFLEGGKLSGTSGKADRVKVSDKILGVGSAIQITYADGNSDTITLHPDLPFVLFRSSLHNGGKEPMVINKFKGISATVDWGCPLKEIATLGTDGLTKQPAKNPGSYAFLAVVSPKKRNGVVVGWLTHDRGSGVVFSPVKEGKVGIQAQIDYGKLRIKPGENCPTETFAVGYFADARLGLEEYADAIAKVYSIKLLPKKEGSCTWYMGKYRGNGACDEKHLPELAEYVAKTLKPFGFDFLMIDDGWQSGKGGNGPAKNFTTHNPKGPYPGGMKAMGDKITELGLTPAIWFMPFSGTYKDPFFKDHSDLFAKDSKGQPYEVPWGDICLDMTNPAARDYLRGMIRTFVHDWGYKVFKMDGFWTGTVTKPNFGSLGYKEDGMGDAEFFNPDKTNIEAFRDGIKLVREAAGPDVFLLGCCIRQHMRSFGGAFGLVDAMRVAPDTTGSIGPGEASRLWFLNGRVWWNDPDCPYVRTTLDIEKARLNASFVAVANNLFYSADWIPELPMERLDILRRCMPSHNLLSRPVDVFESAPAKVWHLVDTRDPLQRRDSVALYNWAEAPAKVVYPVDRIGLPKADEYVGFDFWNKKFVPPFKGAVSADMPRVSCRVISIRPVSSNPQLISTSRHITQGMIDVSGERWNAADKTLSATSRLVENDPYELRIIVPVGEKSWAAKEVLLSPEDRAAGVKAKLKQDGPKIRATITSPTSREVKWRVTFEQAPVDAGELRSVGDIKTDIEYKQITLSWDDTGADAYKVTRDDGVVFVVQTPYYIDRAVKHGVKYGYSVEALCWGRAAPARKVEATAMAELKPPATVSPTIAIADLKPLSVTTGNGKPGITVNAGGKPFSVDGKKYAKGLGVQANSTAVYAIPAGATKFVAVVGADAEAAGVNLSRHGLFSMVFEVYGDTKKAGSKPVLLAKSPVISTKTITRWAFDIGLDPRYKELHLVVDDAGDGNNSDYGDWVDAGFVIEKPKGPVKVFILAGQSNAVGFNNVREYRHGKTALPEEYMSQADTLFWDETTKGWIPLCVGKSHGAHTNAFGPEIGFAHDLAKLPGNGQIAIIKCAVGGTGIARARDYSDIIPNVGPNDAGNNWHPPSNGQDAGKLYQQLMRETEHALSALKADDRKYELSAFLWMQGEREAGISLKMAGDYEALLKSLIQAVRTDLKTPRLPFVIGEVNSHTWKHGDIVRKAQDKVCQEDKNALLVKTTDLSRKGSGGVSHFDADGMIELGLRFATAVNQLTRKD